MTDLNALTSANADYLEIQYRQWQQNPAEVAPDLADFFKGFEFGRNGDGGMQAKHRQAAVNSLVYNFRTLGHRVAGINPLGGNPTYHKRLDPSNFGLSDADMEVYFDPVWVPNMREVRLRDLIAILRETYCGPIGVEYMHIQETAERRWLQQRMESVLNRPQLSPEWRRRILYKLQKAELFEQYLHKTYRGQKRFSLEGAETLIPAMDYFVEKAAANDVVEIVIGMAHRGRLNVLANVIEKDFDEIFSEFEDADVSDSMFGDGDVKYHKGYNNDVPTLSGRTLHLSLTANPSHLEMVGPVVQGKVRGKQAAYNDVERKRVLPFVIHGDAAFAGQGIVYETLNLSQLKGYRTGGTVHFVINNQLGFTTTAEDYQSGLYCTDVAKSLALPIFHVNGDAPEHVIHVLDIAFDYRMTFGKDVIVDMWCYRRHGHNETDEPSFTQPLLYQKIAEQPSVVEIYTERLIQQNHITEEQVNRLAEEFEQELKEARAEAKNARPEAAAELRGRWRSLQREYSHAPVSTGVSTETLTAIADSITRYPAGFDAHRKIRKLFEDFAETVREEGTLAWAGAETLAFGSLLLEGIGVRLSGEDSRRGTFSHRHAAVYDQKTGQMYIPLANMTDKQAQFCVYDSSLAEASVLAFDYGYSVSDPNRLILWEAQFGDFANGAQVIIDQFIVSSQSKWGRMSGIVMLLPHGYEGQGPEHSNAWLGRYLARSAEENMQVCMPTTPAQYFHLLRRQVTRNFRRPLVVMTPKSLLRHPRATSPFAEFTHGHFYELLDDSRGVQSPRRVLFCSGKIYYELLQKCEEQNVDDIAIVRVEQFYPINDALWDEVAAQYENAHEWVWVSEEPENFGAWPFMNSNLSTYFRGPVWFVGRARSASPATGSLALHKIQQEKILSLVLQPNGLEPELVDGVAAFTKGEELWHMKSKSHLSESPLAKAP